MQRIHSIGDGRLFVDDGGGDRRLRHHHHHHHQNHQHHHQALKCPRCDSLNTKFCYYNNYNLSQPRHFCKNCRRYWTKGGVLRNVPVGGGSRKSKRSDNKSNNSSSSATSETAPATTPTPQPQPQPPERNSNSHSSSESSTRTAAAAATEAMPNTFSVNPAALELEQVGGGDHRVVFSETGSVTSLVTSTSTNEALAFGFGNHNHILDASSFRFGSTHHHGNDHLQAAPGSGLLGESQWHQQQSSDRHHEEEFATASLLDHAVPLEFPSLQNKTAHGGFGPLDWHAGADQSLFDLPITVDQPYWTHPHWSDHDNPPLFHLP